MIRASIIAFVVGVVTPVAAPAQDRLQSLVTLYVTTAEHRTKVGTGFAVNSGTFVTAYHVVQGGRSVEAVLASGQTSTNVVLVNVFPEKDLAILNIGDLANLPVLRIENRVQSVDEDLSMLGSASGIPNSTYHVHVVQSHFVPIKSFNDTSGHPLFESPPSIDVLQIAGIIYGGISGGPLVDDHGSVLGVLSGSLSEGGSYGWAIPAREVEQALASQSIPQRISDEIWPPIPFRTAMLRSFEYFVRRDDAAQNEFDKFTPQSQRLQAINNEIELDGGLFSWVLANDATAIRSILTTPRVASPLTVREINESAFLQVSVGAFQSNLGKLSALRKNLNDRYSIDRSLRGLVSRLGEAADRPGLDPKSVDQIRGAAQQVAASDPDVANNTFERRQGIDTAALIGALDTVINRKDFQFSSIAQAEQFADALQVCIDWLSKYDVGGPFGEWVPKEKEYFDKAAGFLRQFRPVIVYVPE